LARFYRLISFACFAALKAKLTGVGGAGPLQCQPALSQRRMAIRPWHAVFEGALSNKSLAGWSNDRPPSITYVRRASELARERKVDFPCGEER
jgi:hypothetical protein